MGALIDNMLLQVHVLGEGVIGRAAFAKTQRWMYSDGYYESQNSLGSFESLDVFEDDSDLYRQFSTGLKTVALISVEPWGVVELGSTQKIPESNDFVDEVKELFRGMENGDLLELSENEPSSSNSQFFDSGTQFSSLLLGGISCFPNQSYQHSAVSPDGFVEEQHPSQSLSSSSVLEPGSCIDCAATQAHSRNSNSSVLTSLSWPHFPSGLRRNVPFSISDIYDSGMNLSFNVHGSLFDTQNSIPLTDPADGIAQRPSGLLTLDELCQEHAVPEVISNSWPMDDFSQWSSCLTRPHNSLRNIEENFPTSSVQNSITDAFRDIREDKCFDMSGTDNLLNNLGENWNDAHCPFGNYDELNFGTDERGRISEEYAPGSKVGTSDSLFSKLGLNQLFDGIASSSFTESRFEDHSWPASRKRKIDDCSWHNDQAKIRSLPNFDGKKKLGLCIGDSSSTCAGNLSSWQRQDERAKLGRRKARPGTRPRPKDRQMIQDRLAELRELIPNGEKMSIDRLLQRTIKHLNFLNNLTKHAEHLQQIDKTKSEIIQEGTSRDGGGGVTWACEVVDQTMVCPLIVKDLSTNGQMLIEILCEEQGLFLEIADTIRGFGFIILKGVMEANEDKIWARFVIEAKEEQHTTRHEIFYSLIQLLPMTG
ncbi:Transcription factor LHW [Sesamum alatum]|uniref:Transcription factor LHW n=1 Tax=Sesamum alatum TaxID=300844 RepID=A0AAE1Y0F1_9LAMI|nr:Transcription factor LHW [Sesamum alatum]